MKRAKIHLWIKVAGWSGLFAAWGNLVLYQLSQNSIFLVELVAVILFSAYVLSTANEPRWEQEKWLFRMGVIALVFISIIPSIFIWIAYFIVRKQSN